MYVDLFPQQFAGANSAIYHIITSNKVNHSEVNSHEYCLYQLAINQIAIYDCGIRLLMATGFRFSSIATNVRVASVTLIQLYLSRLR